MNLNLQARGVGLKIRISKPTLKLAVTQLESSRVWIAENSTATNLIICSPETADAVPTVTSSPAL